MSNHSNRVAGYVQSQKFKTVEAFHRLFYVFSMMEVFYLQLFQKTVNEAPLESSSDWLEFHAPDLTISLTGESSCSHFVWKKSDMQIYYILYVSICFTPLWSAVL